MSQILGKELTQELLARLSGRDIESHEGKVIPIFTVDESGWSHPALLSYYEIVAKNQSTIDMALWKDSSTAKNLRRTGKVTFMISDQGINFYLKASVNELQHEMPGAPAVSHFRMTMEQLLEDQEPNAEITTGLSYRRMSQRDADDFTVKIFHLLREQR